MVVERTVRLRFGHASQTAGTHVNLSAVRDDGRVLWLAGDETATIERLVATSPDEYADDTTFPLTDLVDLPGDADEEADIEGLARAGSFLWAVGSHSLRRKQIKEKHDGPDAIERLAEVDGQANRQVLLRIPVEDVDGVPTLVRELEVGGVRHVAALLGKDGDDLREVLREDALLARFLPIPGKDNGLDVEGIAVIGDRVYVGLRGPVLRGWAVVLELRPHADPDDPTRLRLSDFADGSPYRKHVLDLDGLGVRDLCPDGDDLLVLAGPSMDLDGPVRVYRWRRAAHTADSDVVRDDALTRVVDLAYGEGDDHAEGICLLADEELLVVYDSPARKRLDGDAVTADVVRLPETHAVIAHDHEFEELRADHDQPARPEEAIADAARATPDPH